MRKIFTLFILLLLLPVTALAAEGAPGTLYVGDKSLSVANDSYWTTDANGKLTQSAADQSWNVKYAPSTATLTLNSATIKGDNSVIGVPYGAGIYALCSQDQPVALTIELIGTNTITGNYGIYVDAEQGQTVGTNASLLIRNSGGDGSLGVSGFNYGIYVKSGTGNASLTIENASVDAKTTQTHSGYAGVFVQSGSTATNSPNISLSVDGGSLTASGTESSDGILFYVGSSRATDATTSLTVSNNAIMDARNGGISASRISETLPTPTPTGDNRSGIVFDGTEGTVYGEVELQNVLEIKSGETLTIPQGSTLNGNSNLTNNGTVTIENGGTLNNSESINNTGTINVENGGNLGGTPTGGTVVYAPTITTESPLPEGTVGTEYNQPLAADNSPTQWTVTSGTLPAGLALDPTTGTITGIPTAAGSSTFTVTAENSAGSDSKEYTLNIQAATVSVTGVTLDKTELSLFTGESETLTATFQPANATNKNVTWQSNNANVATVEGGTVTAVKAGEATITVTTDDGDKQATCKVTVTEPVYSISADISPDFGSVYTGYTQPTAKTVTITNTGNQTLNLDQPASTSHFEVGNLSKTKLAPNEKATFTVQPKAGLAAGTYSEDITVSSSEGATLSITASFNVRKEVKVEPSGSTNLSFTTDRDEFTLTAVVKAEGNVLTPTENSWKWSVANEDVVERVTLRSKAVSYSTSRQAFTIKGTGTTTITATYDDGTYRGSVDFKVRISKPTPPDPISYYNIYVEDVCDGVEVSTSKQVVREGGSINVYVEKDTARYTFDNFKVYYKRSYYGGWEELKEGTQPGEYPIKNIWTHIYIKAEGAEEKEDPTGIESIEGVKVYTKDGSLYVQTPQREQVIIVSMSGAVVKNEEQIGLKQYHGLQPGIYIVRVGDRAYKVRLN